MYYSHAVTHTSLPVPLTATLPFVGTWGLHEFAGVVMSCAKHALVVRTQALLKVPLPLLNVTLALHALTNVPLIVEAPSGPFCEP